MGRRHFVAFLRANTVDSYAPGTLAAPLPELLPGNFAKLQPLDGQDLMDGLEIKVQLGSVWKQSLTELSWGPTVRTSSR